MALLRHVGRSKRGEQSGHRRATSRMPRDPRLLAPRPLFSETLEFYPRSLAQPCGGGGLGFHLGFRQRLGAASVEHATAGRGKATPASSMGSHGSCGVRAHALAGWRLNLAPWAAPPTCLGEARALHRTFYVELRWHRVCGPHGIAWVACKRAARTHCLAGLRLRSAQSSCRDSSAGRASV